MPEPLEVEVHEQKTTFSVVRDYGVTGAVFLTVGLFGYFMWRKMPIHFENPSLNIVGHILLVLLPVWCGAMIFGRPLKFKPSDEQRLGVASYFSTLKYDWWNSLLLWTPLAFLLTVLVTVAPELMAQLPSRHTQLSSAVVTAALSFATAGLFSSILSDRPEIRVSEDGFRLSLMTFYEWTKINRVVVLGDTFEVYHQASPRIPIVHVRLTDREARAMFSELLNRHGVPANQDRGNLALIQLAVLVTALVLVAGGVAVYWSTKWDVRWIYVAMVAVSMGATVFFEKFRGVPKLNKIKPKVNYHELTED